MCAGSAVTGKSLGRRSMWRFMFVVARSSCTRCSSVSLSSPSARAWSRMLVMTFSSCPPAADLLDHDAVVQVAFAVTDTGVEQRGVDGGERQRLTPPLRLVENQVHVLHILRHLALHRNVAPHHLATLGVHHLRF